MDIVDFILKYWLEFLLTAIGAAIIANFKKIKEKIKEYREMKETERKEKFKQNLLETIKPIVAECVAKSDATDETIQATLKQLQEQLGNLEERVILITSGVLAMQAQVFKGECTALLNQKTPITSDQYNKCMNDHGLYNRLGGNHDGDQLFELVTEKYKHQL